MARPRVFISSTYFDLKSIRAELNRFVLNHGYEPVEHERNQIPWGKTENLERYCYQEIGFCDILVSIIGGRFGSESKDSGIYSISQMELKTAHKLGKQVYIFVERDVLSEYRTFSRNRNSTQIQYVSVDNVKIFEFLDEVYSLPRNNPVSPFETSGDIVHALQDQWAGLFQRLLAKEAQDTEIQLFRELKSAVYEIKGIARELRQEVRDARIKRKERQSPPISVSPIPKKLKEYLNLDYEPDVVDLPSLTTFLEDHGFVKTVQPESNGEFLFWRGEKSNFFVSNTLWDKQGKFIEIDPIAWSELLFQVLPRGHEQPIPTTMDPDTQLSKKGAAG